MHKLKKKSTNPENYRPVHLLPTINKLLKKIILKRFNRYKTIEQIILHHQFGFREKHNTVQKIKRIINDISQILSKEIKLLIKK